MNVHEQLYIDGGWRPASAPDTIAVRGAATGEVLGRVPQGTTADVDAAVAAARAAFPAWSQTPLADRLALLQRLEEGIAAAADDLAALISNEVGTPIRVSRMLQVEGPRLTLANYRQLLPHLELEEKVGASVVVRQPLGVVACITAWNYPLQQAVGKVGGALATGCTAVLKPSELAPLSAFVLARLIDEAGFPPGVFNLVTGGPSVGQALVEHRDVDMIHFTGSTATGRRIGAAAAATVKRTSLELGGKSANLILDDADIEQAVKVGLANCFTNSGQTCTAWTRMLVPRAELPRVEALIAERVQRYRLGDPLDPATTMGPLASEKQQDTVRDHIRCALAEGARLVCGGPDQPAEAPSGYFVAPTVFSDVTPDMALAQDEVFGPVLAVMPYDTEEEAIELANSTVFGLAGGVWSGDLARAERVARRIRAGQIDINGSFFNPLAPFGGHKQSGLGRELGVHGLLEFYELTSFQYA